MSFEHNSFVKLKDQDWFDKQKIAGKCVGASLSTLNKLIVSHTPNLSLLDLQEEACRTIKEFDCIPTFESYKGFPGKICLSVNKQLVHGIPSNYILQEGDVVKFDLGATYQGVIADAAATAIYGTPKSKQHVELLHICKGSLDAAIQSIEIGKQLGCIGYTIHKYVTSKSRFGLITNYGGHGICMEDGKGKPHAEPFVANKARPNEGIRIQKGLTIAIEPMVCLGDAKTKVLSDGWTVVTNDIGAHFEHTIFVGLDKTHIMTEWE